MNEKKWKNIWRIQCKTLIFASLSEESTESLDYGVMVAQQVLVLFVQVRILVVQQRFSEKLCSSENLILRALLICLVRRWKITVNLNKNEPSSS